MNNYKYEIDYEYERDGISLEELKDISVDDFQDPVFKCYKLASMVKPEALSFQDLAPIAVLLYDSMNTKK